MHLSGSGHLRPDELVKLYEEAHQKLGLRSNPASVHPHLAECSVCRERYQECVSLDQQLENISNVQAGQRQPDCPPPSVWHEIAAGVTAPDSALRSMQHASACDYCGLQLRAAVTELNGEITEAEAHRIAALESARPEWQQNLARRVSGVSEVRERSYSWWRRWATVPRLVPAAAVVLTVVFVGWWFSSGRNRPSSANRLLARAYGEQRTLELRIAGAPYAPLRVQRGPEGSFLSRPPALLEAEALIAAQLASHASDPQWLQAKARADLLEGKYDAAIDSLRRASELAPDSYALLVDLGTAYYQRAQSGDRPEDSGVAYEYLSRALAIKPQDPVALFNRAIIAEQQTLYRQALEDWEHYLRVDGSSEWADEARKRSEAVRTKLRQQQSRAAPAATPAVALALASKTPAQIDSRIEEYLHIAVRSWLPQAYPEAGIAADTSAREALFFFAELSEQQHHDRWLADLLSGSSASNFPQAVAALAQAVRANDAGEYGASTASAALAYRLFQTSGNDSGMLRARFEKIFADQFTRHSESCRLRAVAALQESERHLYPWLQVQLGLEAALCSGLMSDIGTEKRLTLRAMERAQQSSYWMVYLRGLAFAADGAGGADSWKLAHAGLERFWAGSYPAMRGYSLYAVLAADAEAAGWPHVQLAIWRDAVALIDSDEDILLRAIAHYTTANAAVAAQDSHIARQEYDAAARLYALAPQNEATHNSRIENEIRTAQLQAGERQVDSALQRLANVQGEIRELSNDYLVQLFYSVLGEVQLRRGRMLEAEQALRPALKLAEQNLQSLTSEEERIGWSKTSSGVYLELAEAELMQGRSQEALETFESYLGAAERAGMGVRHVSRRESQRNLFSPEPAWLPSRLPLLSDQTVLAYGLLPDGLAIWAYDDRGVRAQWIPNRDKEVQELAERFNELVSDPKSQLSAVQRDARRLYSLLVTPVEQSFDPRRTLVIESGGALARLPFEALLDPEGHYLLERTPIVHSLGLDSEARLLADDSITAQSPALVVASTGASQSAGIIPLPDVMAESNTVASGFRNVRILQRGQVTLALVKKGLQTASVFHFAGHSLATVAGAGLLLDERDPKMDAPRLLAADSLRDVRMPNLRLAVLSACSTAGQSGDSRGFSSVTEALLRAGVPHVVASRWAVDSAETRAFVEDFYRGLLSGIPASEATRLTSRKMLSDPRTAHPYYWSAFAAYGRR